MYKKRKWKTLFALLLTVTLVLSAMPSKEILASEGEISADTLSIGKELSSSFQPDEYVKWFKIDPKSVVTKATHLEVELNSTEEMNISVYSSKDNAMSDNTFDRYNAVSFMDNKGVIYFPIAWEGPYYIKVEYYSNTDDEEYIEEEEVPEPNSQFSLKVTDTKQAPTVETEEACPVELSTKETKDNQPLLTQLRTIRDTILSSTENGKKLSSLYYQVSPFLSAKMIFNKQLRQDVLTNLNTLKPIFANLLDNGTSSTYKIGKNEAKAINNLYEIALEASPTALQTKISTLANKVELSNIEGKTLDDIFTLLGASSSSITNKEINNKYIVKMKAGKTVSSLKNSLGKASAQTIKGLEGSEKIADGMFTLELKEGKYTTKSANTLINKIQKAKEVEYIEPVQQYTLLSLPSDVSAPYQWSLKNTAQTNGKNGADIQFEKLYQLQQSTDVKQMKIAVLDTGVDASLADLKNKITAGYNFINESDNVYDDNNHGTHVSGIIAAGINNGYSMSGIHTNAKIMPVKILDASGSGDTEQIAKGIKYAVDHGAKVINMSLGGGYSRVIESMLQYANSKNVTIIAASGNNGYEGLDYPGSSKYVTAVGASNDLDIVADYSSYGKELKLVAPGSNIPSLVPNGNLVLYSGTSMATPHVSAVAGLLLSLNGKLKPKEVEKYLIETTTSIVFKENDNPENEFSEEYPEDLPASSNPIGFDKVSGWGRLNAFSAFSALKLNAKINPVYNSTRLLTGTAEQGSKVSVKLGSKTYSSSADKNGKFTVEIPLQKPDKLMYIQLSSKNGNASTSLRTTVQRDTKAPNLPTIQKLGDNDSLMKGTSEPFAYINAKVKGKLIGKGNADKNGKFAIKIKKQKANTIVSVTAADGAKNTSKPATVKVVDNTPPPIPTITGTISNKSDKITGKAEANSTVTAKAGKKKLGSAVADKKGKYTIKIKKQKENTKISVTATDKAKNISKAKTITVVDKIAPAKPKVNTITTKTTKVTGTSEKNATIIIKRNNKVLAEGKTNKKGAFSIKIKKQKEKTSLTITAKDTSGNVSKPVKKVVTKAK
ncbi:MULTISPECIES: S8 family peptidase [Niallia]|jgi:cell wall-associated protease|uniref:S8 family peptidase n=1 Tax=Niallia TaxID=2837506 RepID=UPI00148FA9E3|nr:Ig-like domain-containing protein [Niallia circulans]QJX62472.1 S8 family serine peptidase [Niallia circulans]